MSNSTVVSVFQSNIEKQVVASQAEVVRRFLPADCAFHQVLVTDHGFGIDECLSRLEYDLYVMLDIDCIPLNAKALPRLIEIARSNTLIGCVQRANHINNGSHLFAGPCGVAFSRELFENLGRPSFRATARGDVGEEVTYRCEEVGYPVELLWPTHVVAPKWALTDNRFLGHGTTYADALFHAFEIRWKATEGLFLEKCRQVIANEDATMG
jgi:hypothetical protein